MPSSSPAGRGQVIAALRAAEVAYGGRPVLGPLSLDVRSGEIVALLGPSGCGKSTALRLLAGLEAPSGGSADLAARRGEISVVFQAPTLMPWASAAANVALPLALSGEHRGRRRPLALAALEKVGLAAAAPLKPRQLSGGMAMRVSLARALVTRPRLLLMDEPFAALDEITRRRLAEDVQSLWSELQPGVVFVTHSVEEAVFMAQRIIVLDANPGRIRAEVQIEGPLPRPAGHRFSAPFRRDAERISSLLEASAAGSAAA